MQSIPIAVGVDVAKATLSVCVKYQDGSKRALSINNIEPDIMEVAELLGNFSGKIVMESTGHYHWLAALLFSEAGHDVRVINPLLAKKYSRANIRKVKSDKVDAEMLAYIALHEEALPTTFNYDRKQLKLRKKLSLIASLGHELQALHAMLNSFQEARAILEQPASRAERQVVATLKTLAKQIKKLELEFMSDIETRSNLTTIPGVSPFLSAIAQHWFVLQPGQTKKSWIAYAGLDVSVRESGTWYGQCHVTKRGNSYLRRRLYSAAWGAYMSHPEFKRYYTYLRARGRSHVEALVIIARKITVIMFEMTRTGEAYDPTRPLFVPAVEK
ncbi:MAG: IS110 family transposase [Thiomicrospira sp.]